MKNKRKNTMIKKETINNNMSIVRNVAYNHIKKMNKDIKEVIELDTTLLKMIDINIKNKINKIINDYKVYQQTGVLKIK